MRTLRIIAGSNGDAFGNANGDVVRYDGRHDHIMPWWMRDRTRIAPDGSLVAWDTVADQPGANSYPGLDDTYYPIRFSSEGLVAWFGRSQRWKLEYDFDVVMRIYDVPGPGFTDYTRTFAGVLYWDIAAAVNGTLLPSGASNSTTDSSKNFYLDPDPGTTYPDERYLPHGKPPGFDFRWGRPIPDGDPDGPFGGNTYGGVYIGVIDTVGIIATPLIFAAGTNHTDPPDTQRGNFYPATDFYLEGHSLAPHYLLYYDLRLVSFYSDIEGRTRTLSYATTASLESGPDDASMFFADTETFGSDFEAILHRSSSGDTGGVGDRPAEDYASDHWTIRTMKVSRCAPYWTFDDGSGLHPVWDHTSGDQIIEPVPPGMP